MSPKPGLPQADPAPGAAAWAVSLALALVALLPGFLDFWPWNPSHLSMNPEGLRTLAVVAAFLSGAACALAGPGGGVAASFVALLLLPPGVPFWIGNLPVGVVASDVARGTVFSIMVGAALGGFVYRAVRRRVPRSLVVASAGSGFAGALVVALATAGGLRFSFYLLGLSLACLGTAYLLFKAVTRAGRLEESRERAASLALEKRADSGRDEILRASWKKVVFVHGQVEFACRPIAVAVACLLLGAFTAVAGVGSFLGTWLLSRVTRLPGHLLAWPALSFALGVPLAGLLGLFMGGGTTALDFWLLMALCAGMGSVAGQWCASGLLMSTLSFRAALIAPCLALSLTLGWRALAWLAMG